MKRTCWCSRQECVLFFGVTRVVTRKEHPAPGRDLRVLRRIGAEDGRVRICVTNCSSCVRTARMANVLCNHLLGQHKAIANLSWSFATISVLDDPLMTAISLRAVCVISEFACQHLSNSRLPDIKTVQNDQKDIKTNHITIEPQRTSSLKRLRAVLRACPA